MSTELLPAGVRGSRIITEQQLAALGIDGIARLNAALEAEIQARGLLFRTELDPLTLHYIVEWKPDPRSKGTRR